MGARRTGRGGLVVLLVAIVVVGVVATSVTVARADPPPAEKPVRVVHWPADIAPIADRVEQIRGLRFRHAIPVRHVQVPNGSATPVDASTRAALETAVKPLVALGMVGASNNVASLFDAASEPPAGVYTSDNEVIRVFVPTATASGRAVLAHELTHALEDQRFPQADRRTPRIATQVIAYRAVVEGSASRVQRLYVDEPWEPPFPAQRVVHPGEIQFGTDTSVQEWEWFAALGVAPYTLGTAYVDATLARGDVTWDRIIADPPISDVVIVDPLAPPGSLFQARGLPSTTFSEPSAIEVYLVLASRIDPADALDAMLRSSGSLLTTYERDGRPCADLTLLTRRPDDPSVTATLDKWIASAGPANASRGSVSTGTRIVEPSRTPSGAPFVFTVQPGSPILTSCRGVAAVPFGSFFVPLALLVGRNEAAARAMRHGFDETATACIADAVLTDRRFRDHLRGDLESRSTLAANVPRRVYRRAVAGCDTAP